MTKAAVKYGGTCEWSGVSAFAESLTLRDKRHHTP